MGGGAIVVWLRRDLRLADHPALAAAAASGRPVIPVFVCDSLVEETGAAAKWRLGSGIAEFARSLAARGSRLVLRRGEAGTVLPALVAETGASAVYWTRAYGPAAVARDTAVKAGLRAAGIEAQSFDGSLLAEPWQVTTGQGGPYRVYTPFWKALRARGAAAPLPAPAELRMPAEWPASDRLEDWGLARAMDRGAAVVAAHVHVGEAAALARLEAFLGGAVADYAEARDYPARAACSGLSENLTYGEISPRTVWHRALRLRETERGVAAGVEKFLSELAWRDFAWHLAFHSPAILDRNWRAGWDGFPWRSDNDDAEAWRRGMTGEPMVDAAMREMYVTGTMHNRARMIAASYLTKHLLTDWRVGQAWFADCLTDWDEASNAMGWQWVAGSGPDAAPFFRVFNPAAQADRFDPDGSYRRRFIAEGQAAPAAEALAYFRAVPRRWGLSPGAAYPGPVVGLGEGRERALAAYARHRAEPEA